MMKFGFKLYFSDQTVFVSAAELKAVTEGNLTTYHTDIKGIAVTWRIEKRENYILVTLNAESDAPLNLKRVDSLCLSPVAYAETDRVTIFTNRLNRSGNRYPHEMQEGAEQAGDGTGLFANLSEPGMAMAAVVPFANLISTCAVRKGDKIEFCAKTELTEGMQRAKTFASDKVIFAENITIDSFYDIYQSLLPQSSFPMPKLMGWNTWDYYLDRVTPEDIFENIDTLKKMPFAQQLKYIVLDDGWQKDWGVWTENDKFACGLGYVAERIREAGFHAGIWMAPLLMKDTCEGFSSRMDWFLKDENGEYAREIYDTYILDPTHPEARAFVLNNYKYLYGCGYRLFKIDYLSALLPIKNFYDRTATPYSALADLIRDVQACTGEDAVVLGCSLPIQCGGDIAPSMRIGVDIHNHFSHVEWIAESLSWTWMYNNRVTRIDPDFMVVRGEDTADEPLIWEAGTPKELPTKPRWEIMTEDRWRSGKQFNAVEAETWANLVAISGGNIFLSDRMSVLNERGISILERAIATAAEGCRPCYLPEDRRLPSVWRSAHTLLLINWEDAPVTKVIHWDGALKSDKEFQLEQGELTVTLLPHESFLAEI